MGVILFGGWYNSELCRVHPEKVFVFGDNLRRFGKGGQAIIRDEPNAFGVATKRKPAMTASSFFAEDCDEDMDAVLDDIHALWMKLKEGATVVVPVNKHHRVSLGLERAELPLRAPSIYAMIQTQVAEMMASYGDRYVENADAL